MVEEQTVMKYFDKRILWAASILAVVGLPTASSADSRIFSVKTNTPGVTVEQVFRNDEALALVGHGGDAALFRIDNSASTPVPCVNRLVFVTSTGERIDRAADFCALNWDLTLDVAAAAPPPATDAPDDENESVAGPAETPGDDENETAAEPASDGNTYTQTVTVRTDDPSAVISEVFLDDQPVAIKSRDGEAVQIEVVGGAEGISCQRALGLRLADGRRLNRDTNICLNAWTVIVALDGEPMPATQVPPPIAPPPAQAGPDAPPAPVPMAAAPLPDASSYAWTFSDTETSAALVLGVAQSDNAAFIASCVRKSGQTKVSLPNSAVVTNPGNTVTITLSAGGFSKTYQGSGSPVDVVSARSHPEVEIAANDPLWSAMIRETALVVAVAPASPVALSLTGSAGPTRQFVAACDVPAAAPPAAPSVAGGARSIQASYYCGRGHGLTVTYDGRARTALVDEDGAPPILLYWTAGGPGSRYVSGRSTLVNTGAVVRWSRFGGGTLTCR